MFGAKQPLCRIVDRTDYDMLLGSSQAYYAKLGENEAILDFCRACEVDYLIVDERDFTQQTASTMHRPDFSNSYLSAFFESLDAENAYALQSVPDHARLFQVENFYVAACDENLLADSVPKVSQHQ